ncbi:MAG TPA: DUF1501 domain-containing protein [Polyangiaceae bacterium]
MNQNSKREELTRRAALQAALSLSAVGVASRLGLPALARAASVAASQRRFVFCYFPGGWDQLLFLDPRDPDADGGRYQDANKATTLIETRYGSLQGGPFAPRVLRAGDLRFGPATERISQSQAAARLSKYADRIAIVRGINMGTLGHEIGMRYFLTARFPAGATARGSSLATECAALQRSHLAIPVLSLGLESYNEGYPGLYSAMRVDSIDDLLVVLDRAAGLVEKDPVEAALTDYARTRSHAKIEVYDRTSLIARMREADEGARATLGARLVDAFGFVSEMDAQSVATRARYGFARGDAHGSGPAAAFAATAIKRGVAQSVSVTLATLLDTHAVGNPQHADALNKGVSALAALLDDLATSEAPPELQKLGGRTWLDHTTVLAFSEFARSPLFNPAGGRDHFLGNSCLLAGAGIAGGRVAGVSGAVGMGPCRYDYREGKVVPEGGDPITPENIRATLLASAGLPTEADGLHAQPLRTLLAPA